MTVFTQNCSILHLALHQPIAFHSNLRKYSKDVLNYGFAWGTICYLYVCTQTDKFFLCSKTLRSDQRLLVPCLVSHTFKSIHYYEEAPMYPSSEVVHHFIRILQPVLLRSTCRFLLTCYYWLQRTKIACTSVHWEATASSEESYVLQKLLSLGFILFTLTEWSFLRMGCWPKRKTLVRFMHMV